MKLYFGSGRATGLAAALLLSSGCIFATPLFGPLTGTFGITGPGVLVFNNGSGADFIQFCTTANATASGCTGPATSIGNFSVTGPGTNSFTVLSNTDSGTVLNTTDNSAAAGVFTYLPVGVTSAIDNYLAITDPGFVASQGAGWDFQANLLAPATCSMPIPSQECIGPFQLNQNNTNVNVFMDVYGTLINKNDNSKSSLDISFSATYDNTTIATVVSDAQTPTGAFNPSWAATITASAVPEPSTASMLIAGGCLLALSQVRRKRRSRTT